MVHLSHMILNKQFDIRFVKGDPYIKLAIKFLSKANCEIIEYFEQLNSNMRKTQKQSKI